jgi:hypothetical protein
MFLDDCTLNSYALDEPLLVLAIVFLVTTTLYICRGLDVMFWLCKYSGTHFAYEKHYYML